jgi:DNA transformation protein and related proteins
MDPEAIRDLFAGIGPVRVRRMFGGQGIYAGELMFALEAGGELFLKADDETVDALRAAGSAPFVYDRDGRHIEMSYWRIPAAAADDPDEASRWARLALEAARRAGAHKQAKTRPRSRRVAR